MSLSIRNLSLTRGTFQLEGIQLELTEGAYGVLMGRTGCGKSSLLETIAGLHQADAGEVLINGTDVTSLPPRSRGVGYVPQDGALFSKMTVQEQLEFAPKLRGLPRNECSQRASKLATDLSITHLFKRRPQGLSGGERQRVALGRALAAEPKLLLLDEPLSAVDEETRDGLLELLLEIRSSTPVTILHVTHDSQVAERVASQCFMLRDGQVTVQAGERSLT